MHKTGLVQKVARETRLSQRIVNDVLTESLQVITDALRDGQTVTFPGFGTFYTKHRPPGKVTHIRTNEVIELPAMRQADFRVGELLRQAVRRQPRVRRRSKQGADGTQQA